MKLLFDQNLSPRLVDRLIDVYPDSSHVAFLGLDSSSDDEIWSYARANDYAIVTKDADLNDLSVARGFPPKLIWLQIGNCTTRQIEFLLRAQQDAVTSLYGDASAGILTLL